MILVLDVFGVAYVGASLNKALLEPLQALRANGLKGERLKIVFGSNMASTQKILFWNAIGLKKYGEEIFCSGDLKVAKPEPAFYSRVQSALGVDSSEILFFDDSPINVAAAIACGWQAFVYETPDAALNEIGKHYGVR